MNSTIDHLVTLMTMVRRQQSAIGLGRILLAQQVPASWSLNNPGNMHAAYVGRGSLDGQDATITNVRISLTGHSLAGFAEKGSNKGTTRSVMRIPSTAPNDSLAEACFGRRKPGAAEKCSTDQMDFENTFTERTRDVSAWLLEKKADVSAAL